MIVLSLKKVKQRFSITMTNILYPILLVVAEHLVDLLVDGDFMQGVIDLTPHAWGQGWFSEYRLQGLHTLRAGPELDGIKNTLSSQLRSSQR